jgi:hypothetical protein
MSNKFERDLKRPPCFAETSRVLNFGEASLSRGGFLVVPPEILWHRLGE